MERKDKGGKGEPQKMMGHPHPTLAQPPNPGEKRKEGQGERKSRESHKRKLPKVERKKPAEEQLEISQKVEKPKKKN